MWGQNYGGELCPGTHYTCEVHLIKYSLGYNRLNKY